MRSTEAQPGDVFSLADRRPLYVHEGKLPSPGVLRQAARYVVLDLLDISEDRVPAETGEIPGIQVYFPNQVLSRMSPELITHVNRYAYADGLHEEVLNRLISGRAYSTLESLGQGVWFERTHYVPEINLVSAPFDPNRRKFAKLDAIDNPFLQFADDLEASHLAAGQRFREESPQKSEWLMRVHDGYVDNDPASSSTKNKLYSNAIFTGVEAPYEFGSLLWFLHEDIFPRTGSAIKKGAVDVHSVPPLTLALITVDILKQVSSLRMGFDIGAFVQNRPGWKYPDHMINTPGAPNFDSSRIPRFEIDPAQVDLRYNKDGYYLDTGTQLARIKPEDPVQLFPTLMCPAELLLGVTKFNLAALNSAYGDELFGPIEPDDVYPYMLPSMS